MLKKLRASFYRTEARNEPVRDWLKDMSKEDRARVGEAIKMVEFGWPVGMPTCRPMGKGLFEIRVDLAGRTVRVLFCIVRDSLVLLHGFTKKTEATPDTDLKLALARMRDVLD